MKKRILSLVLVLILLVGIMPYPAQAAETSGEWEYTLYEGNAVISGYSGSASSVTVPGTIDGLKVVGIGSSVFQNHYNLVSVILPDSLQSIGSSAFQNCTSLTAITLPEELESVGSHAFYNCKALSKVTVQSTKLGDFYSTGNGTFYNAGKEVEDGITVEFIEGVTRIPARMFSCSGDYYARIKNVSIPGTVTEIDDLAFQNCYDLQTVTIASDSALQSIGSAAFQNCTSLTAITLPEELESVGSHAFYNCKALSKVTVQSTKLGDFYSTGNGTFYNAGKEVEDGITVEFTEGVTRIPARMFSCSGDYYARIKNVSIPSTVTEIGKYAFYNCYDLCDVYYGGTKARWSAINIGDWNEDLTNANIHYASSDEGNKPATPPADGNTFVDVASDAYYYAPVQWAVKWGITAGMDASHFAPDGTCTRAQIATFLWRLEGSPESAIGNNPFVDVSSSDYFYRAVLWAYNNKVTSGVSDSSFAPNAPCTRGQVATFLWRYFGEHRASSGNIFTDIAPGAYYYDAVLWAVENGITNGMGDGTFAPDATCTRGQIVTFLYRAMA